MSNRFMDWKDLTLTPAVWLGTLVLPLAGLVPLNLWATVSSFGNCVLYFVSMQVVTLVVLKIMRIAWPHGPGIYREGSPERYRWNLYNFLLITNLFVPYLHPILPMILKKPFYALLGTTFGKGIVSIGGKITDAHIVSIAENALIGDDAFLCAHALTRTSSGEDVVLLAPIEIQRGALIGMRTVIMPGVVVGEEAVVNAGSFVAMNTRIPPREIWGGNPAQRLGSMGQETA